MKDSARRLARENDPDGLLRTMSEEKMAKLGGGRGEVYHGGYRGRVDRRQQGWVGGQVGPLQNAWVNKEVGRDGWEAV